VIAVVTQTETIVWSILGFTYLVLLLYFVRTLLRGPKPIHWQKLSFGVFVEKTRNGKDEDGDTGTGH
jgi:hypothetical protein